MRGSPHHPTHNKWPICLTVIINAVPQNQTDLVVFSSALGEKKIIVLNLKAPSCENCQPFVAGKKIC